VLKSLLPGTGRLIETDANGTSACQQRLMLTFPGELDSVSKKTLKTATCSPCRRKLVGAGPSGLSCSKKTLFRTATA